MPIQDNVELQEPQTKEWPLIPADVYQVEITDIEYKEVDNKWKQKTTDPDKKQVMVFEFTIIEEGPHYGRKMWKQMAPIKPYPPDGGKETWVYKLASALAGHAITRGEADKFTTSDVNGFIHRQVRMTLSESAPKENGKRYNNIDSFLSVKSDLPLFDEKKVPNASAPSGYEKAKEVASNLPAANPPSALENSSSDMGVAGIPF